MAKLGKARVPTESERKRLFAVTRADAHGLRNCAMLAVSYFTGMRAKEIASLRIRHVRDENGKLREECRLSCSMTKGGVPRVAYLTHPTLRQALKEYLDERAAQDAMVGDDSALFKSQYGGGFSANSLQQLLRRLHDRAGIVGGRSHSGRRYFCTTLIERGADIRAVQVLMAHASVNMTMQYCNDNPQRLRRIVAEML